MLEKLAAIQALDVWLPTIDGRTLVMPRYTEPDADAALLLHHLRLELPQQPPPRLTGARDAALPQIKYSAGLGEPSTENKRLPGGICAQLRKSG